MQIGATLDDLGMTGDEATGVRVVRKALSSPTYWIADNAGAEGSVVVDTVAGLPRGQGFNAAMCDGSVHFISKAISDTTLRAAITRDGGEVLGADF